MAWTGPDLLEGLGAEDPRQTTALALLCSPCSPENSPRSGVWREGGKKNSTRGLILLYVSVSFNKHLAYLC